MVSRTRNSRSTRNFPLSPTLRQPAQELGPRATRTVALILEAAKSILLTHGYAGTTVDEIARVAGMSRASFYTYFPSKRDVLLALGVDSAHSGMHMIDLAAELTTPISIGQLEKYVRDCFDVLDDQASFAFAWTQAAQQDEEIRVAGMKRHLQMCGQLGRVLGDLRGQAFDHAAAQGLALFSELERAWSYCQLYSDPVLEEAVQRAIAGGLYAVLGGRRSRGANRSGRSGS
jgi:AcrR family transcriptional regulator